MNYQIDEADTLAIQKVNKAYAKLQEVMTVHFPNILERWSACREKEIFYVM